jgi:ribosome biogenesis GTPase A
MFEALKEADVVLEVVDARFADLMEHTAVKSFVKRKKKKLILVQNKSDLIKGKKDFFARDSSPENPIVNISCNPKRNISLLRSLIYSKIPGGGKIAVIGYPNTGKSSLINVLVGRHAAPTSRQAGFTKGRSLIKLKEKIYVIDTPGVIPFDDKDPFLLVLVGAKSSNQLRDPQHFAEELLDWMNKKDFWKDWVNKTYDINLPELDAEKKLEALAVHLNRVKKGGLPDTRTMSIKLLQDWQKGTKNSKRT